MSRHFEKSKKFEKSNAVNLATPPVPTARRATMRDVAAAANVSVSAVSIAMRDSPGISRATRSKILRIAEEIGYQRNRAASLMKLAHTGLIGFTLNPANPFHVDLGSHLHSHAADLGREIVPAFTASKAEELDAIEFLQGLRCAGLILLGTELERHELTRIAAHSALAVIGHRESIESADMIYAADDTGQEAIISHLAALGHRDIAHIDGGSSPLALRRRSGYERAMGGAGLLDYVRTVSGGQSIADGKRAAHELLDAPVRPTAICAFNDEVALGAYDTITARDMEIPRDICLTGYDNTAAAGLNFISLTTVDQQPERLTHAAVQAVIKRMEARTADANLESTTVVVEPDFIARGTTSQL